MKTNIKFKNEFLIELRKEQKLSQEDLATLIDVSRQTISKWETGEKIPDLDNVNKLCQVLKVDINQLIEGIYETENKKQSETNIKNKKTNMFKKIILVIVTIYAITVVLKAVLFSYILYKNDRKHIDSFAYDYNQQTYFTDRASGEVTQVGGSRLVFYKNKIWHIVGSWGITDTYTSDTESWMYLETQEYYEHAKVKSFEDNIEKEYDDYHTGAVYTDITPFELLTSYHYKLGIIQILNPTRFYPINDEGEMVIPLDEYGSKLWIDIKTGYLTKAKLYTDEYIYSETDYMGVQVNAIEDSQVNLSEERKNEIIENSKKLEVDSSDIYYNLKK